MDVERIAAMAASPEPNAQAAESSVWVLGGVGLAQSPKRSLWMVGLRLRMAESFVVSGSRCMHAAVTRQALVSFVVSGSRCMEFFHPRP